MSSHLANQSVINAVTTTSQSVDVGTATSLFFTVVIPELFGRVWQFVSAPFIYGDMWWLLIHLVLSFILFEWYFDRHKDEDMSWAAALANSIVMIFIGMELLRHMYYSGKSPFTVFGLMFVDFWRLGVTDKTVIVVAILALIGMGVATAVINYFHLLPKRIAFIVSGHHFVNLFAYLLMVLVWNYTHGHPVPFDFLTLVALLIFGVVCWFALLGINALVRRRRRDQQLQW